MAEPRTQKAAERIEKRVFAKLDEAIKEASKKEAARRAVWLLEEQERRRRMREEAIGVAGAKKDPVHDEAEEQKFKAQEELLHVINYAKAVRLEEDARLEHQLEICKDQVGQDIIREITRTEVLIEEAKERKRRMEEPGGGYDPLLSDLHDKVQEQFMSEVSRKESKKLEEAERRRRVYIDRKIEQAQDFETAVERNLSYLKTIIAEENERDRRIMEELGYGTSNNPIAEEIVREVTRRQTWVLEERERARRMFEGDASEIENEMERLFAHEIVLKLEEEERKRRMDLDVAMQKEAHEKKVTGEAFKPKEITEFPAEIQEEFMSAVSRIASRKAEEKERNRRIVAEEVSDEIRSEANLFLTWALEERERRRRIFEEACTDFEELLQRQTVKEEVLAMEEKERERRIRQEKTHKNPDAQQKHQEELNEEVRQQMVSQVNRKQAHEVEEEERKRRIAEEKLNEWRAEERQRLASKLSRLASRKLEEEERERRIHADLQAKFQETIESELDRRRCIALEEEERIRRVMEGKKALNPKEEAARHDLLAEVLSQQGVPSK